MATVVFKSRIDWWIWAVLAFSLAVVSVCFIGLPWWLTLIYGAGIVASFVIAVFGTWYAIDEEAEEMIVYQFFRPRRYPVGKIRDVRFTICLPRLFRRTESPYGLPNVPFSAAFFRLKSHPGIAKDSCRIWWTSILTYQSTEADCVCLGEAAGRSGVPDSLKNGYGRPNSASGFFPGLMYPSMIVSRPDGFSNA